MSDRTVDDHVRTLKHLAFCEGDQSGGPEAVSWALDRIEALQAEVERLTAERDGLAKALAWYGEQARLARLIHSEGDAGRRALDADGGARARAALAALPTEEADDAR